ncbi:MAG TPA: radical SAM protein [Pseudomonadales bacterium]|nr:radical SAM protein [Pseudomonadales bacterium]
MIEYSNNNTLFAPRPDRKLKTGSQGRTAVDIEWTNRCNATCSFCPRDKMPAQGMMQFDVYKQVLKRCKELPVLPVAKACGTGEPLIHPKSVEYVRYASEQGFDFNITTNASLLTAEKSKALFDAGLSQLNLSVSATGQLYNHIYNLEFDTVRRNIEAAVQQNPGSCKIMLTIVEFDDNRGQVEELKDFWRKIGINRFNVNSVHNRGGYAEQFCQDANNTDMEKDAFDILAENKMSHLCAVPYIFVMIGWDGQYYLCCHDWKKRHPMGSVFDISIEEAAQRKLAATRDRSPCKSCSADPVNQIRMALIATSKDGAPAELLQETIDKIKPVQQFMRQLD